ncbi:hypothetical protein V6N13_118069 [Hibiscus sabdariffa]|uniref:Uncharacterized protein n=1 Tax=Hibiscus sabdariffa TaxID=183260 RepID=A0ABR2Q8V9_9ROSI
MFTTTRVVPLLVVNVEPKDPSTSIPLHATEKQGDPEEAWVEFEIKVASVWNNTKAEVVVLRFTMDHEILPCLNFVVDYYMCYGVKST